MLGEPAGSPPLRRRVGYVTQAPRVYGDLTVRGERPLLRALLRRAAPHARRALADVGLGRPRATSMVGHAVGRPAGARASLACALVGAPELLVLDEPTVGLDPVLRHDLWARFRALAEAGTTLLVSSHVMDEAGRCDRLLLMRDGRLVADDTPAAVRAATGTTDLEEAFLRLIGHGDPLDRSRSQAGT